MSKDRINVTKAFLPPIEEYIEMIKPIWNNHILTNMGPIHDEFQLQIRDFLKVPYCLLYSCGHMSLEMMIKAMDLKGEVITTPYTFVSTTHAIVRNNLKPVFCDIKEDFTIDENKIEELITDKTSAIVAVHVYGNPCNIVAIDKIAKKYGLKVIYDGAHAFGVEIDNVGIGNFGDGCIFSFHATKPFNCIEGGATVFNNLDIGYKLYKLKNFGIVNEETVESIGANCKLNEFQAAMGLCNLKYYNDILEKRKELVSLYRQQLCNVPGISIQKEKENIKYNYAYFPIVIDKERFKSSRDDIYNRLKEHNIYPRKYFYPITTELECYKEKFDSSKTPIALKTSKEVLTLPLYYDLTKDDIHKICNIILNTYEV